MAHVSHKQRVFFSTIFFPSAEGMSQSGKLGETPADHLVPVEGSTGPTGRRGLALKDGLKPTVTGQSLMKCAIMCDSFLVILVFNLRHLPNLINFHANSIFFTHQSYHKKGAVVGKNLTHLETRGPQCLMTPRRPGMTVLFCASDADQFNQR